MDLREWHYIRVGAGSDGQFLNTSGLMSDARRVAQTPKIGLGTRRFAHMQGSPVLLHETGGDTTLHRERLAQSGPGLVDTLCLQTLTDGLDELIRQHGNEQMAIGALLLRMEGPPRSGYKSAS